MLTWMMLVYMVSGAALAVFVIFWALRTRQFHDQDRARYLPLKDLSEAEMANPPQARITPSVALAGVILLLGLASVVGMLITAARAPGGF